MFMHVNYDCSHSVLFWQHCNSLYTSGFVANIMFGLSGQVYVMHMQSVSLGGSTGAKSYVCDCLVLSMKTLTECKILTLDKLQ